MNTKEIGEMIRVMRMSRSMTQEDLAAAACIAPSTIAMYETGKRRPSHEAAEALADAFNVPIWAIYYREDEMQPINPDSQPDDRPKWIKLSAGKRVLTDAQLDLLYSMAHAMNPKAFPLDDDEGRTGKSDAQPR